MTVSVEMRIIVNRFVFLVIKVHLSLNFNTYTFGHCVILSKKITPAPPKSECACTPTVCMLYIQFFSSRTDLEKSSILQGAVLV